MYENTGSFRKGLEILQKYKKDRSEDDEIALSRVCNEIDLEENTNPGYVFAKKIIEWVARDKDEKGNAIASSIVMDSIEKIAAELFDELNDFKEEERVYFLPTEAIAFYFMFVKFAKLHLDFKAATELENYEKPFESLKNRLYEAVTAYTPKNIKMMATRVLNFNDIDELRHISLEKSSMPVMDVILDEMTNNSEYPDSWDSDKKRESMKNFIDSQKEIREKFKSPIKYLNKCKRKTDEYK